MLKDVKINIKLRPEVSSHAYRLIERAENIRKQQKLFDIQSCFSLRSLLLPSILVGVHTDAGVEISAHSLSASHYLPLRDAIKYLLENPSPIVLQINVNNNQMQTPCTVPVGAQITIKTPNSQDLVQLSPEQLIQLSQLSPLNQISLINQINGFAVIKPNLYLRQTVTNCFNQNKLPTDSFKNANDIVQIVPNQNFVIPFFSVLERCGAEVPRPRPRLNEKLYNSALKRLRFSEFCSNIVNGGMTTQINTQVLRRKFILGNQRQLEMLGTDIHPDIIRKRISQKIGEEIGIMNEEILVNQQEK
ncbi:Hypothetical_protein [Hexamita inflata]|uniref:Hypothetical_protein n=1 Tax=Hexamita inflata TaxID=28002 RepID=A0AA86TDB5_9EUKA|nr:Hypothetical protein HINF_LOCUS3074 [Hexamita inflata]